MTLAWIALREHNDTQSYIHLGGNKERNRWLQNRDMHDRYL